MPTKARKARQDRSAAAIEVVSAPVRKRSPVRTAPVGGERKTRRNRRSEGTIRKIFAATEEILHRSGADRISILDVCNSAGISRGTFYRYFSSQDELVDAYRKHEREQFHRRLLEATQAYDDPDKRFDALIRYLDTYLDGGQARRLLVAAPEFALHWFTRIFHDSILRFQDVLKPVFDAWDARLGMKIDRELVCELLIRFVLSDLLVPAGVDRRGVVRRIRRMVSVLATGRASRW